MRGGAAVLRAMLELLDVVTGLNDDSAVLRPIEMELERMLSEAR